MCKCTKCVDLYLNIIYFSKEIMKVYYRATQQEMGRKKNLFFCLFSLLLLCTFFLPISGYSLFLSSTHPPTAVTVFLFFSSSRSAFCTAPWKRLSSFSGQLGQRVRPGPAICGLLWDQPYPGWVWRGFQRLCLPSGHRGGGMSHAGTNPGFKISGVHRLRGLQTGLLRVQ